MDPHQAKQIRDDGGLLIDIRPAAQRAEFGEVPGALIVERNNLEWRLDPGGSHRLPEAEDPDRPVVIICQEGYASSLAAASLMRCRPHRGHRPRRRLRGLEAGRAPDHAGVAPLSNRSIGGLASAAVAAR